MMSANDVLFKRLIECAVSGEAMPDELVRAAQVAETVVWLREMLEEERGQPGELQLLHCAFYNWAMLKGYVPGGSPLDPEEVMRLWRDCGRPALQNWRPGMMSAKLQAAEDFLRRRLAEGPQAVECLIAEAPVSRRTVFRAAEKIGVVRLPGPGGAKVKYWALPAQPADEGLSESASVEKVSAEEQPAPIAATEPRPVEADQRSPIAEEETDKRIEWAIEKIGERIGAGLSRAWAVFEVCQDDTELTRQVKAALGID